MASSALEFESVFFVPSGDDLLALNLQEEVSLQIMEQFQREAIAFAYSTQTLFLEGGPTPPEKPPVNSPLVMSSPA
ncbi:hypothetical protein [Synechococcus sp. CS-1328]|uniref:hypothetical protein n=1 Tax=Synechococcus sp. CS-1328 TaxID=2847976 RepID=UPI00223AF516|nr:hypothetical protein [Synechococcus sp. CS-1328]MCT0225236.1 hypothetical protein [Synechococcus sp. CS-1328]